VAGVLCSGGRAATPRIAGTRFRAGVAVAMVRTGGGERRGDSRCGASLVRSMMAPPGFGGRTWVEGPWRSSCRTPASISSEGSAHPPRPGFGSRRGDAERPPHLPDRTQTAAMRPASSRSGRSGTSRRRQSSPSQ
jgi:hypothetical protein